MTAPRRIDGGWVRDTNTWTTGGWPSVTHLAGPDDETPAYRGRYSFDCSPCYFGHSHTEAKHNASVAS